MAAKPKIAPEFTETEQFIRRYCVLPSDADYRIAALWALGTWTFSPAAPAMPATYPYLYVTGQKGSGKTQLAAETFQWICRNHKNIVSTTGAALFRMIGTYDEESGEIVSHYPTLAIDEIDSVYAGGGSNDEQLRGVSNGGYKRGATVPRAMGKTSIEFPIYTPKVFIGIDNGRLPETVLDRCIRIEVRKATPEQLEAIEEGPYSFDVEEESAELKQRLSDWAKREAMIVRDYRPERIPGISPRQWEIARTLVQLAKAVGNEKQIRADLAEAFSRRARHPDGKIGLYRSILSLFNELDVDRLTTRQILARLSDDGIHVPGDSGKGLAAVLASDGITSRKPIRLPEGHPGRKVAIRRKGKVTGDTEDQPVQRGYMLYSFDDAFSEYLEDDE